MSEVQTAARTVKTLADKIAETVAKIEQLNTKLAELRSQEEAEAALAGVSAGYVVTLEAGRAETRRTVEGTVLAVYEVEGKRKVKVIAGEGAGVELFEVEVSRLLSARDPSAAQVCEDAAE